jgi:class 3 adenylate cyclase
MGGLSTGGFGSAQRLALRDFVLLGLLTGWIYTAVRFSNALGAHFARRWSEVEAREDLRGTDPRLYALRAIGFTTRHIAPWAAAALFALAVALAAWSFHASKWVGGAAAGLFYAGTFVLVLWGLDNIRRHETLELLVRERGAGALLERPDLGDEVARRRERQNNHVVAFLVLAAPMLFSPLLVPPAISLPLLALFHAWGTALVVGFYNGHLAEEARHALTAPGASAPDLEKGKPQRARVAIMLTDMQGYSKSMGDDESAAYARLVEHNRIMRTAIAAHRGREIKTMGDAFLVIFRSAVNALECALAAQKAFAAYNAGKPDKDQILVRVGVHLGEVILTGTDIFGDDVNVVARIEPLASPGGICLSEAVLKVAGKKVKLEVQPVEGATLKNIASPPALFRIGSRSTP